MSPLHISLESAARRDPFVRDMLAEWGLTLSTPNLASAIAKVVYPTFEQITPQHFSRITVQSEGSKIVAATGEVRFNSGLTRVRQLDGQQTSQTNSQSTRCLLLIHSDTDTRSTVNARRSTDRLSPQISVEYYITETHKAKA